MQYPRFAAILYVNRSGSTLLSRRLSEHPDVFVLPEVQFIEQLLLDRREGARRTGDALFDLVRSDPRRDALGIDDAALRAACRDNAGSDLPALLTALAKARLGRVPAVVAFKRETLIYLLDDLRAVFGPGPGGLALVHIVRDPRAVANSMLRTPVPEKPGFNMARGDVVFAARHWRRVLARVRALAPETSVAWIRYENLQGEEEMPRVLGALGLRDAPSSGRGQADLSRYAIGAIDRELHPLVFGAFDPGRVEAWRTELSRSQIRVVERICGEEMDRLSYPRAMPVAGAVNPEMVAATVQHWRLGASHALRTFALYLRRPGGVRALAERARLARSRGAFPR